MAFDYRKEYKEFYLPPKTPGLIQVPELRFVAVHGTGDPNDPAGDYQHALNLLYGISFTIKMSYKGDHRIAGYFEYKLPPLEGFWRQPGVDGFDYGRKETMEWISVIRLPDFVTREEFDWAVSQATAKKKQDYAQAKYWVFTEGLCVQCLHLGPYDSEPATVAQMDAFAVDSGCALDFTADRWHHEIYLTDPRKGAPEKQKTVLRHPVRRLDNV